MKYILLYITNVGSLAESLVSDGLNMLMKMNETLELFSNRGSNDLVVGQRRRLMVMRPRQQHSTMCHFPHSWRRYIEHKSGSHFTGLFTLSNTHIQQGGGSGSVCEQWGWGFGKRR